MPQVIEFKPASSVIEDLEEVIADLRAGRLGDVVSAEIVVEMREQGFASRQLGVDRGMVWRVGMLNIAAKLVQDMYLGEPFSGDDE